MSPAASIAPARTLPAATLPHASACACDAVAAAIVAACIAAATSMPAPAQAPTTIRRCMGANGVPIYTDKRCEDVGGTARAAATDAAASGNSGRRLPQGCPRTLRDLIFEVGAAIDARDANRLASVYHWTGMSTSGSQHILDRLDDIAQRPLVQVSPMLPAPRVQLDAASGLSVSGNISAARVAGDDDTASVGSVRRTSPIGLRVDQTNGTGIGAVATTFGLRRTMGCWFIQL